MDKQTLSNYGWLVIVTLILAVMLALATPFGTYVGDAVVSVANGFVSSSNQAMNEDNIGQMQNKWEEKLDFDSLNKIEGSATFSDGVTLSWEEIKENKNAVKYGYNASAITNTSIGVYAFCCPSITSFTIPSNITSIGYHAFNDAYSLVNITIPDSVTSIGDGAFGLCSWLKSITYTGTTTQWNNISFGLNEDWNYYCGEITVTCTDGTITIPANSSYPNFG